MTAHEKRANGDPISYEDMFDFVEKKFGSVRTWIIGLGGVLIALIAGMFGLMKMLVVEPLAKHIDNNSIHVTQDYKDNVKAEIDAIQRSKWREKN